jgi:hypothetical protein
MLASVRALLSVVIDYAGLFPPARLTMRDAMTNYVQDQMSPNGWMLNCFVVSASRLAEFETLVSTFSLRQWSLSVILSGNGKSEIDHVVSYHRNNITVTTLEFPPIPPTEIARLLPHLPTGIDAFFEIPLSGSVETYLATLQNTGTFAKVRTGGITADAFPSTAQLGQFIVACAKAHVPFKATAGLHHPLPGSYRLTYEPHSPSNAMHGFLNVIILAALIYWQKITSNEVLAVLQGEEEGRGKRKEGRRMIDGFQFQADGIVWGDRHLSLTEIEQARQNFFRSFGSCSFSEPIHDLKELGLLS